MADNLYPTADIPEFSPESDKYDTTYRPSLQWDLEAGDFVRTLANKVPRSKGTDAYKIWCVKAAYTVRYACLAYSDEMGTEMDYATSYNDRNAVELAIQRTITEALMVNPRTVSVEDFIFAWNKGHVSVRFTVKSVEEEPFTVDATLDSEA